MPPVLVLLRVDSIRLLAAAILAAGLGACAGHAGPSTDPRGAAPDPCELEPAPESPPSSLTVVVTAPIEPHRLWLDANPGERFVLAHLYETLVRVDCRGVVRPGLASSWRFDPAEGRWILTLREAARFWNGEPATAGEILGTWRETAQRDGMAAMARVLERAMATDDHAISIMLSRDSLRVLADPAFLVRRERAGSAWPEGTGPYRPVDSFPTDPARAPEAFLSIRLEPVNDRLPNVTIHAVPVAAARDLVDVGVDLLLTDAPELIAYAASQPGLDSAALEWSRLYLLMTTVPEVSVSPPPGVPEEAGLARREALARDVVRGAARAAKQSYWWGPPMSCVGPPPGAPSPRPSPGAAEIAYDRADPAARALAERLAAVAAMSERSGAGDANALVGALRAAGSRATAVGLSGAALADALGTGVSLAYVLDVPVRVLGPCLAWDRLLRRAPWIGDPGGSLAAAIVTLVETRWTVLHRHDRLGLSLAWDGTPVLAPVAAPARHDR